MKKLTFLLLTIVALASCTKESYELPVSEDTVETTVQATFLNEGLYFKNNDGALQAMYLYVDDVATGDTVALALFAPPMIGSEHFVVTVDGPELTFTAGEGPQEGESFCWSEPTYDYVEDYTVMIAGGCSWYLQD